jgi:arsenical pump membrane protein
MPAADPKSLTAPGPGRRRSSLAGWALAVVGVSGGVLAVLFDRTDAHAAADQVWSPFVLVAGLLLVGLVADDDGLYSAVGHRLARVAPNGPVLFAGAAALIAGVTALLNLDTSVVFLTPVLLYAAQSRGQDERPLLVSVLLLSNAASLLLPGSNLTNLIVVGQLHLSGGQFLGHMVLPWIGSVVVTTAVIAVAERRSLGAERTDPTAAPSLTVGLGVIAVPTVTILIIVLRSPALPVAAIGVVVFSIRLFTHRERVDRALAVLGLPVLVGLFGVATALGTAGRAWSGPAVLLSHLDTVGTAAVAAVAAVVFNNLPAASLLSSRVPPHPFSLLIGLDIGPNLFVTGSLAWVLWRRAVRSSGSTPPVRRAVVLGLISVPLAMAAALGLLTLTGYS